MATYQSVLETTILRNFRQFGSWKKPEWDTEQVRVRWRNHHASSRNDPETRDRSAEWHLWNTDNLIWRNLFGSETQCQENDQEFYPFPETAPPFNPSRAANGTPPILAVSSQSSVLSTEPRQPSQVPNKVQQQINILMAQMNLLQHQQNQHILQENEQLRQQNSALTQLAADTETIRGEAQERGGRGRGSGQGRGRGVGRGRGQGQERGRGRGRGRGQVQGNRAGSRKRSVARSTRSVTRRTRAGTRKRGITEAVS